MMLLHDARHMTDDGRQPIAIGHLSDSGDVTVLEFGTNVLGVV